MPPGISVGREVGTFREKEGRAEVGKGVRKEEVDNDGTELDRCLPGGFMFDGRAECQRKPRTIVNI